MGVLGPRGPKAKPAEDRSIMSNAPLQKRQKTEEPRKRIVYKVVLTGGTSNAMALTLESYSPHVCACIYIVLHRVCVCRPLCWKDDYTS